MTDTNKTVATVTFEDIKAFVDERRRAAKQAIADLDAAMEGLTALGCMTLHDDTGIPDFGKDREVITNLIRGTREFMKAEPTKRAA
ncbi:MAG: hypothetical protein V7774_03710 [Pseudorhizobium pelagicum]|uniref:hypothetical protein n=1 Tax=Pseudorhizobium pelagicum TaxID=1509405 RepID=UPI0034615115